MVQGKKHFADQVHSVINKGLGIANGVVGAVGTFKGLYEIGSFLARGARALGPVAGALL